jgi:isoleucyl-tRNA synthetase
VLKDRLYTSAPNSCARRSAQTAIWRIGEALVRLLATIMSFTAEEIWSYLPKVSGRVASPHIARFPSREEILGADVSDNPEQDDDWKILRAAREHVLRALEEERNKKLIGTGLEAQVRVTATDPAYSVLARYRDQLRYIFIVSDVEVEQSASGNGASSVTVRVSKAPGKKCERCWNYSTHVGEDPEYPSVCERCSAVLKEIESEGAAKTA